MFNMSCLEPCGLPDYPGTHLKDRLQLQGASVEMAQTCVAALASASAGRLAALATWSGPQAMFLPCVSGFRFRVSGFGFRASGFGFKVQGSGSGVKSLRFKV